MNIASPSCTPPRNSYDSHFVLDFVHRQAIKPSVITTGHKILRLEAEGVTFIDSLNFFPMALSKLPEAFGLEELTKGFFPHLWNTLENQNYVGAIPDASFYGPDQMHRTSVQRFTSGTTSSEMSPSTFNESWRSTVFGTWTFCNNAVGSSETSLSKTRG